MASNNLQSDTFLAFVSDKETLDIVKSLALSRYGLQIEAYQANVKTAIAHIQSHNSPRILLMDLSGSDFPLTDMQSVADACEPGVKVIAIGEANDVGLFRSLVSMGVKDYIAKPLNVRLLVQSLENLMGHGAANKNEGKFAQAGKLVSFLGTRGGVGSSTLAANFAWGLSHGNFKRVCMVDLDFHTGIMNQILNIEAPSSFADLLKSHDSMDENILMQSVIKVGEYLSTLGSPVPLDEEFVYPTQALESCLPTLLHHFHYTVLDFPKYDHRTHYSIIAKSDVIVLTLEFSLLFIREVVSLLRILKSTQDVQIILLANNVGAYKKGELERKMFEESIGQEVDLVIPFDPNKPLQSINEGVPAAAEKGAFSDGVYNLVSLVTGKQTQNLPQGSSFLGNLFGGKQSA